MKTNRTIRRLAIIVGTLCLTTQAPAMAETPASQPTSQPATQQPAQIKAPADQRPIMLASASCTRVGNRMVC